MNDRSELRCEEVSLRLQELLAGELAQEVAHALELHVASCARCARERGELEALERLFERDAAVASTDVAEARMQLRRALVHANGSARVATTTANWRARRLWRELPQAAGFLLLLALFVPTFPRLKHSLAPAAPNDVARSLAHEARELVASVGAWLPTLPEWSLSTAPPESLRTWFGALHSDAH